MSRKTGKPLTSERIVEAAMGMVDEHGLSGLNMRSLGAKLGVKGMAVYYYFPGKNDIVDALVGELMKGVDLAADESDWLARMRRIHASLRAVLLMHPNLLPAVILRPFNMPSAVRISETVLDVLLDIGFDEPSALHAYQTLRAYVLGYAVTETVGLLSDPPSWDNRGRMTIQDYGEQGFTRILQVIPAAAVFNHDEEFSEGLEAILSGLQGRLAECVRHVATPSREQPTPSAL